MKSSHDKIIEFFGEKSGLKKNKVDWFRFDDDYIYVRIREIEKEEFYGDVFNLQTEKETYTVGNIVVHNCYQILYDRVVNDDKMSNNWFVVGATNLNSDRAYTHEIAPPLKDRCGEVELKIPNVEDWTINFAIPNKVDSRIIGYVNFKKSALHNKVDWTDNQKFVTPRSWKRMSDLISGVKDYNIMRLLGKSAIGEGTASEFVAFCEIQEKFKLEDLIKNPHKIEKIEKIDVKYFLVSAVAEQYSDKNNKLVNFDKVMEISSVLDKMNDVPFVALLWRLSSTYTKKSDQFRNDFDKSKKYDKFIIKYGKYIN